MNTIREVETKQRYAAPSIDCLPLGGECLMADLSRGNGDDNPSEAESKSQNPLGDGGNGFAPSDNTSAGDEPSPWEEWDD